MSYLQRPPIDVDATAGCNTPEAMAAYATERLLRASTGPFPFAGAIIRNALTPAEIEAYVGRGDNPAVNVKEPKVIGSIDYTIINWWDSHRPGDKGRLRALRCSDAREDNSERHYDYFLSDKKDTLGLTEVMEGLVTVIATVRGSVEYGLSVMGKDLTKQSGPDACKSILRGVSSKYNRFHRAVAYPGDLVVFTNIPPTLHEAKALEKRESIVFFSSFATQEGLK